MKKLTWLIYKHTCKINGKSYIGLTRQALHRRWQNGRGYSHHNQLFGKAVRKYGWKNFEHEVLEANLTFEQAIEREQYWIQYFHTWIGDPLCNGYNMTLGGSGMAGHICSEATRKRLSLAHLGKPLPESQRQHIKEAVAGSGNPFYGKRHTDDTKEKIRQKALGRKLTDETKQKISKAMLGRKISDSARKLLSEKLTGKKHSAEFCERVRLARLQVEQNRTHEERLALNKRLSDASTRKRRIKCLETGDEFDSLTAAAKFFNISPCTLTNHLAGRTKSVKKLHFKAID